MRKFWLDDTCLTTNPHLCSILPGMLQVGLGSNGFPGTTGYVINQAIRFNDDDSAYMHWTPSVSGDERIGTFRAFVKRGSMGSAMSLFCAERDDAASTFGEIGFDASNKLFIRFETNAGSPIIARTTSAVFRDVAWYDIKISWDANQTDDTSCKIEVNGSEVTAFDTKTNPSSAQDLGFPSNSQPIEIGRRFDGTQYFDGYLAEVSYISGTALDATSFGETDDAGYWNPIDVSGLTFGTNGFLIQGATDSALGDDTSGNTNDFTTSGLAAADQVTDVPTDDGTNEIGNFCTWNPLKTHSNGTLSDGNLVGNGADWSSHGTIVLPKSGKWYWETTPTGSSGMGHYTGIRQAKENPVSSISSLSNSYMYYHGALKYLNGSSDGAYGASYTNDVIGIAYDADAGTLTMYKNNVSQGTMYSSIDTDVDWVPCVLEGGTPGWSADFGQLGFTYTPPSGHKALNTANLPSPADEGGTIAPQDQFDVVEDTGANIKTTADAVFSGAYMGWIKDKDNAASHQIYNTVRGTSNVWKTDSDAAGTTYSAPSGNSVAWMWKLGSVAGGASDATGDYTAQVSSGIGVAVATYTASGTPAGGETVAHGCQDADGTDTTPELVWIKCISNASTNGEAWSPDETDRFYVNNGNTPAGAAVITSVSSTLVTLAAENGVNGASRDYEMISWASIPGLRKVTSFTGNNSADGPYIHCGFKPRRAMFRRLDTGDQWAIFTSDLADVPNTNPNDHQLYADSNSAEVTAGKDIDFCSNGIKIREAGGVINAASGFYIVIIEADQAPNGSGVGQVRGV